MPPQQELPFSQTLSALRKADLIRLSVEFRLSVDGSVVTLRNRLKKYLNSHSNTLYHNPRYTALYPKHRRPNQSSSPPPSNSPTPLSPFHSTSPQRSPSPASSYESWNGIGDKRHDSPPTRPHRSSLRPHFDQTTHHHTSPALPADIARLSHPLPDNQVQSSRKSLL